MIEPLGLALVALGLVLAVAGGALGALDRRPGKAVLQGVLALQLLLVVQAVVAAVRLVGGAEPDDQASVVGYLIGSALGVPGAMVWSFEEQGRYGPLILGAAGVVVTVLQLRLLSLWSSVG